MKIEVGKFYKTRCGNKVRIYAVDGIATLTVHGAISFPSKEGWVISEWTHSGKYFESGHETGNDIVSEWEDRKTRMLAYLTETGAVLMKKEGSLIDLTTGIFKRVPHLDEPEKK